MNTKIVVFILGCLVCLSSCQVRAKLENKEGYNFPKVIDTVVCTSSYERSTALVPVAYEILYIGKEKDTLIASHYLQLPMIAPPFEGSSDTAIIFKKIKDRLAQNPLINYGGFPELYFEGAYKGWDSSSIQILLDTNTVIKTLTFKTIRDGLCTKAYPVLLKNQEKDTIFIGKGKYVPLCLEAKNPNKEWKAIEKIYSYRSSTGVNLVILPPDQILLTACPIYQGDFKTDLRLKLGNNYSKSFRGSISLAQFEEKP